MNILITGSSGYLGSSFIQSYQDSYTIHTFSLQQNDLNQLNIKGVEAIIHCAALVHQKKEHTYSKYHEINTVYPVELAKKAKQDGVKQFIFISTIAVYNPEEEIISSRTEPDPVTPYGKSKLEAEQQLLALQDPAFKVAIFRIPMIYGVNAPGNIDTLIKLITKLPILPFGNIQNKRSFIYIENITNIIHQILQKQTGGILIVADDASLSTTKLIASLANGMNKPIKLIKIPFFSNILQKLKPQIYTKLYDNLEVHHNLKEYFNNYLLPYSVEEGLSLTTHRDSKLFKLKQ